MNVVLILLLALLIGWAGWRTARKFRKGDGCCGEYETAEKRVSVSDRNRAHYPFEITLEIGGMTCENCARKVENALNRVDGLWATVSISDHKARVLCKTAPDGRAIREAVRQAGYTVTGGI